MIKGLNLAALRNGEFLQFCKDSAGIVLLNDPAALQVTNEYQAFTAATAVVSDLFKTDQSNPITEEVQALDLRRDNAITGIAFALQGFSLHFDATIAAAASLLNNNLAIYGPGIARDNYQSETATLNNIINDWKNKPNMAAAIAALGIQDWAAELEAANTDFNTKYLARTQSIATASPDTMKAKRLETANAYYTLRDNIDAYFTIKKGAAPFDKVTNELNALVDQYNSLLNGRAAAVVAPPVAATPIAN